MDPKQIAESYNQIAGHWASSAFPESNGIAQHERAIRFAPTRGPALDVGCGSSGRIIELLLKNGFLVEGLDLSPEMLALAKRRHPAVTFHHADITQWKFPRTYDFISAWDSIWHVTLNQQRPVLRKLCDGLRPQGILIFTAGGVDQPGEISDTCLGQPLDYSALGITDLLAAIGEFGCVCRHLEYDQYPEPHLYLIVQKR